MDEKMRLSRSCGQQKVLGIKRVFQTRNFASGLTLTPTSPSYASVSLGRLALHPVSLQARPMALVMAGSTG